MFLIHRCTQSQGFTPPLGDAQTFSIIAYRSMKTIGNKWSPREGEVLRADAPGREYWGLLETEKRTQNNPEPKNRKSTGVKCGGDDVNLPECPNDTCCWLLVHRDRGVRTM